MLSLIVFETNDFNIFRKKNKFFNLLVLINLINSIETYIFF